MKARLSTSICASVPRRSIGTLVLVAAVAGCVGPASQPPVMVTAEVPIAKLVYCDVAPPAYPVLPIANLGADSAPADTVRAYAETIALLKSAVRQRDALIESCADSAQTSPLTPLPSGEGNDDSGQADKF